MFETANLSELTLIAPTFHNRKPIPLEIRPRNKSADKLVSLISFEEPPNNE